MIVRRLYRFSRLVYPARIFCGLRHRRRKTKHLKSDETLTSIPMTNTVVSVFAPQRVVGFNMVGRPGHCRLPGFMATCLGRWHLDASRLVGEITTDLRGDNSVADLHVRRSKARQFESPVANPVVYTSQNWKGWPCKPIVCRLYLNYLM